MPDEPLCLSQILLLAVWPQLPSGSSYSSGHRKKKKKNEWKLSFGWFSAVPDPWLHPTRIKRDAGCLWSTMTVPSFLLTCIYQCFFPDIEGNLTHFQKNCQLQKNKQKKITDNSTIQKLPFVIDILLGSFLYTRTYKCKYICTHNIYIHLHITHVYVYVTYIKIISI